METTDAVRSMNQIARTLLARGPANAMLTDVRWCLPSSRSQVICSSCQPGYYPKEKDGSKDCRICSVEDKGTQIALWCGVAVLSLLVLLLFSLWLGNTCCQINVVGSVPVSLPPYIVDLCDVYTV